MTLASELSSASGLRSLELSTVSDLGPTLEPGSLPSSLTRLCCVPAPSGLGADEPGPGPGPGPVPSTLPDLILDLPRLVYLDISGKSNSRVGGATGGVGQRGGSEAGLNAG